MSAQASDVKRGRAILFAALLSALAVVAALALRIGPRHLLAPGALGLPHERVGLQCATCHEAERRADACRSCHGEHASNRPAHRALVSAGRLSCPDCHRAHDAEGLEVEPSGALVHFAAGDSWPIAGSTSLPAGAALPLLPAERCRACHDAARPSDPAAQCFSSRASANLCFDEHQTAGTPRTRSGLTERARVEALKAGVGSSIGRPARGLELAAGFAVGVLGLVFAGRRVRATPRGAPAATPALALPRKRLPVIDAQRCLGCAACVEVCPHEVLEVSRYVAVVARPDACCGLALCAERCPNGSLTLDEGELESDVPLLAASLEVLDQPGVFLAGDVTGQSLIRVAVEQGARAARAIASSLAAEHVRASSKFWDLLIIGAGPAGLSAALEAKRLGLRALLLEQGRVAESIRAFPRDKIVLDSATTCADDSSLLWVGECDKDQLVRRWLRSVRAAKLELCEQARVTALERRGSDALAFAVTTGTGQRHHARRLLIAVGVHGSPRKLDVPLDERVAARVHYLLSDARSFAGRRVVVVGLGDSAMEAAVALAGQSGTSVTVVYRGSDFNRGKRRNIDEFRRLCELGRIRTSWSSQVRAVGPRSVSLAGPEGEIELDCDALFVMIGSETTTPLLAGLAGPPSGSARPRLR